MCCSQSKRTTASSSSYSSSSSPSSSSPSLPTPLHRTPPPLRRRHAIGCCEAHPGRRCRGCRRWGARCSTRDRLCATTRGARRAGRPRQDDAGTARASGSRSGRSVGLRRNGRRLCPVRFDGAWRPTTDDPPTSFVPSAEIPMTPTQEAEGRTVGPARKEAKDDVALRFATPCGRLVRHPMGGGDLGGRRLVVKASAGH